MSTEANKAIVSRFYEEVLNAHNLEALSEFIDSNGVDHGLPPGFPSGYEGTKMFVGMYLTAFPDLHVTVEDAVAEGDMVVTRIRTRGTHQGAFMGIPPTGKSVATTGIDINRMANGKSVEHWIELDTLSMLQQMGVIPAPGQGN